MRTVAEHQQAVRALLGPLAEREAEHVRDVSAAQIATSRGHARVLAADVTSPIDLPPFDNSQMDGHAVRASEIVPGGPLRVAARIAAGHPVGVLEPRTAAPIMTGAPVPRGADTIIPIEAATPDAFQPEDRESTVTFSASVTPGAFVRPRGSDVSAGELLLPAGTRLGAAQWGVLSASGVSKIDLISRLRVLVLSTGDEVTAPGEPLEPGRVYDANGTTMAVALLESGAEVVDVLVIADDAVAMRAALALRVRDVDVILTTGGVSKGAYEVVRDVFEDAGVDFVGVAVQPGGPQGLGMARITDAAGAALDVPVIAFPGNPVSALVSFELFLRPVVRELHGLTPNRTVRIVPLATALDSPASKHQVRRGRLTAAGEAELVGGAGSHLLHDYASSAVLIHIPIGVCHMDAGEQVEVWSIDD